MVSLPSRSTDPCRGRSVSASNSTQQQRSRWVAGAGLMIERRADRDRGRDLVRHQVQREVERCDPPSTGLYQGSAAPAPSDRSTWIEVPAAAAFPDQRRRLFGGPAEGWRLRVASDPRPHQRLQPFSVVISRYPLPSRGDLLRHASMPQRRCAASTWAIVWVGPAFRLKRPPDIPAVGNAQPGRPDRRHGLAESRPPSSDETHLLAT